VTEKAAYQPCMSRHFDNIGKPRPLVEWLVTYGCKNGHEQVAVTLCDRCAASLVDGHHHCVRCVYPQIVTDLRTTQKPESGCFVSGKTPAFAAECGDEREVPLPGEAWVRYRCDLSEGHDGPHNDFLGLYQWDAAPRPDPSASEATP
jgi:hypothetical protein